VKRFELRTSRLAPWWFRFCLRSSLISPEVPLFAAFLVAATVSVSVLLLARAFPLLVAVLLFNTIGRYRWLGPLFGVSFSRSDEWETSRDDTSLALPFARMEWISKVLMGITLRINDPNIIKALKQKQRQTVRELDFEPHFRALVGNELTVAELEDELVRIWTQELHEAYDLPEPHDKAGWIAGVKLFRKVTDAFVSSPLKGAWLLLRDRAKAHATREHLRALGDVDGVLLLVPFLTTIDTTLINLVVTPNFTTFHSMFEHTPVKALPMLSRSRGLVFLDVVANHQDNPGNSAFGPKGVICPGNMVTCAILAQVQAIQQKFSITLAPGSAQPKMVGEALQVIGNAADVKLIIALKRA
jgi:hypothetical protein